MTGAARGSIIASDLAVYTAGWSLSLKRADSRTNWCTSIGLSLERADLRTNWCAGIGLSLERADLRTNWCAGIGLSLKRADLRTKHHLAGHKQARSRHHRRNICTPPITDRTVNGRLDQRAAQPSRLLPTNISRRNKTAGKCCVTAPKCTKRPKNCRDATF